MPRSCSEADEVAGPAHRDRRGAERVLEDQVPADDPGEELAERGVGVGVCAAGDRDHRRELGVAEPGERAADRRDDHREHERRAGVLRRGRSGQHEDAGADDRADAERREVPRAERAPQQPAVGLGLELVERFRREESPMCLRPSECRGIVGDCGVVQTGVNVSEPDVSDSTRVRISGTAA